MSDAIISFIFLFTLYLPLALLFSRFSYIIYLITLFALLVAPFLEGRFKMRLKIYLRPAPLRRVPYDFAQMA